jgi:hypothetical protein
MAYLPLSTANLPDPAIDPAKGSSPADYFDVFTWTGTGNTGRSFTDLSFQPDLVWAKNRNKAYGNVLYDSVRGAGANKELSSDITGAEGSLVTSIYDYLSSFDSNGFTSTFSGSNFAAYFNDLNDPFVAWNWKANGSGVSNTDGSITSTVSANTESGFSVVSWSGNQTSGADVGHGLNSAPQIIITKCRTHATSWVVGIGGISGFGVNDYLILQTTNAKASSSTFYQAYDTDTFTVGVSAADEMNKTGRDYISYCFHSVEGFSKFSSYTGNGSTDGPFVYTGFRPAFLLVKHINGTQDWHMLDSERGSYNVIGPYLYANSNGSENNATKVDFLSNGFKIRVGDNAMNSNGNTLIYMAFAENPFKYSNAR